MLAGTGSGLGWVGWNVLGAYGTLRKCQSLFHQSLKILVDEHKADPFTFLAVGQSVGSGSQVILPPPLARVL